MIIIIAVVVAGGLLFYSLDSKERIKIAVILPDVGFAPYEDMIAAKMAVSDYNKKHNDVLDVFYFDSDDVLQDLKDAQSNGINMVVGPHTSAQLSIMKDYADSNDITIISPTSTASSLAFSDDKIYRLSPDDTKQAKAISSLLDHQHIDSVVLLVRNDTWGTGLSQSIKDSFDGNIVNEIVYSATNPDVVKKILDLANTVNVEIQYHKTSNFAVIVLGFEGETLEFMQEASTHNILDDIRWYGTDAITNSEKIASDPIAFEFIQKVSFKSVLFAVPSNQMHDEIEVRLYEKIGYIPSVYAYSVYDSIWIAAQSLLESKDVQSVAESYSGALGDVSLNDAGDLDAANYDVWTIGYGKWYKVGTYDDTLNRIVWGN